MEGITIKLPTVLKSSCGSILDAVHKFYKESGGTTKHTFSIDFTEPEASTTSISWWSEIILFNEEHVRLRKVIETLSLYLSETKAINSEDTSPKTVIPSEDTVYRFLEIMSGKSLQEQDDIVISLQESLIRNRRSELSELQYRASDLEKSIAVLVNKNYGGE